MYHEKVLLQKRLHLNGYTNCCGPIGFRPTRKVWVTSDVVVDTSRTLKASLLRSADCLFSVLRPYSESFFPFSILPRRQVRDTGFFFLITSIYAMRPHNDRLANLQKGQKNCEILNLEAGKAVRNGSNVVRCSKFPSGKTSSGIMGIGSQMRR